MSCKQICRAQEIFVIEKCYLQTNLSVCQFCENFIESLKMAQHPKNVYGVHILIMVWFHRLPIKDNKFPWRIYYQCLPKLPP